MFDARKKVMSLFAKYSARAMKACDRGHYNSALFYCMKSARLMYEFNFMYSDKALEDVVKNSGKGLFFEEKAYVAKEKRITLVDTFGYSFRGLAWIYVKGILDSKYELQYLTVLEMENSSEFAPLKKYMEERGVQINYITGRDYVEKASSAFHQIKAYCPANIFFHGKPWDAAVLAAISALSSSANTYLINLTDHAFWLGSSLFDYYLEFRSYGYSLSYLRRGIEDKRLVYLPYYPSQLIESPAFLGLSFGDNTPFFLSGGSAYKIAGSDLFYEMVNSILSGHDEIHFLFLSNQSAPAIEALQRRYPGRVHSEPERLDLLEVMRRARFYLSTYPINGSLMTQIAASAGVVPINLLLSGDEPSAEMLLNASVEIDYATVEEVRQEADKLIKSDEYFEIRANEMRAAMMKPEDFAWNLNQCLVGEIVDAPLSVQHIDDEAFVEDCLKRSGSRLALSRVLFSRENLKHLTILSWPTWVGFFLRLRQKRKRVFAP